MKHHNLLLQENMFDLIVQTNQNFIIVKEIHPIAIGDSIRFHCDKSHNLQKMQSTIKFICTEVCPVVSRSQNVYSTIINFKPVYLLSY